MSGNEDKLHDLTEKYIKIAQTPIALDAHCLHSRLEHLERLLSVTSMWSQGSPQGDGRKAHCLDAIEIGSNGKLKISSTIGPLIGSFGDEKFYIGAQQWNHSHFSVGLNSDTFTRVLNQLSQRFFYALRLRSMVVNDFFFTRSKWNNIAGLGAILLVRANPYLVFGHATPGEITQGTLFDPLNIRKYLEYMQLFFDSGTTDVRYPVVLKEHTYNEKIPYEDNTLRVHQIPIFPPEQQIEDNSANESKEYVGPQNLQQVDVAFLVELKKGPKAINASKLIALKVPNGPLIGQLKAGKAVKLQDGRVIKPEQVYDDRHKEERGTLLVVELESIAKLQSLSGSPVLQMSSPASGNGTIIWVPSSSVSINGTTIWGPLPSYNGTTTGIPEEEEPTNNFWWGHFLNQK